MILITDPHERRANISAMLERSTPCWQALNPVPLAFAMLQTPTQTGDVK
jgi:hypothetical protein